jgi:RecB family exonuclease
MRHGTAAVTVIWRTRELARAVEDLAIEGPLPCRTVLVPREVLATAEIDFEAGEEALRPARLLALFRTGITLEHFGLDLLRNKPGWEEAFARTIGDLEDAGFRPEDLKTATQDGDRDAPRLRDVATIWRGLDAAAGRSWTTARIYGEAARALEERPSLWWFPGPTLAVATGHTPWTEARFLRAIPDVRLALRAARPVRKTYVSNVHALFGIGARDAILSATASHASASERDLLTSYLFEPPAVLGDPERLRSNGPDGTVDLEEHAGVDAELEATTDWVARQILSGAPLEDIAVLVPLLDPLAGLVAERLSRLSWKDGVVPVYVAGGLPVVTTAGGARALAVVRALREHLSGDALAHVLPAVRTVTTDEDADERRHLTHGAAMDLVWSLGTAGGNAAEPHKALDWSARAASREADLPHQLEEARAAGDDAERAGIARPVRDLERLLKDIRAVRPALDALVDVARLVVDDRRLAEIWAALRNFLAVHVLQPGEGSPVHALLDDRLEPFTTGTTGELAGDDALRLVEETIAAARIGSARFGDPAIYVGTVRSAVGLPFRVVRVIGLAEGYLPPAPHEDPVLPDRLRERLQGQGADGEPVKPRTSSDTALAALHALDVTLRDVAHVVALSAPRLDVTRSQREPSSILLEAAAALGRPNSVTGEPIRIPDLLALRRDYFAPARTTARVFRLTTPVTEGAWQDAIARRALGSPGAWLGVAALDLGRIAALANAPTRDGLLSDSMISVPGITRGWPISASALETLLGCPYRFFLQNILRLDEPAEAPPLREIGQPYYGALVHRVAEAFLNTHGEDFCAGRGSLEAWESALDAIVEHEFTTFLEQYPLIGGAVRGVQKNRLRQDVHDLLAYDWASKPRRFVAAERVFGQDAPVDLPLGGRSLFVRGRIDRLEVTSDETFVRDLKTGRAHPREGKAAAPDPSLDVQIAVYALVTQRLAETWGVPKIIRAAYAYVGRSIEERVWSDFHGSLEPAARAWLGIAADLLAARAFPRTPDSDDCQYCAFRPVCGDDVYDRARSLLARGEAALDGFRALKGVELASAVTSPRPLADKPVSSGRKKR